MCPKGSIYSRITLNNIKENIVKVYENTNILHALYVNLWQTKNKASYNNDNITHHKNQ